MRSVASCPCRSLRFTVPLVLLFLLFGGLSERSLAADGALPWDDPIRAGELQVAIDSALAANLTPGASVSIRQGDARWRSDTGLADISAGTAPSADTYFGFRSVTKSFVATVVLQMAQEGLVDLDDPVGRYVAGVPGGDTVTLRQLAEMRSGIFNYSASDAFRSEFVLDPGRDWTARDLLAFAFAEPLQFAPGTQYEYSNSNTLLLGEVISAVTGNSWSAEVAQRLSGQLGLASVLYPGAGTVPSPNAVGYADDGSGPFAMNDFNATGLGAAGGLYGVIGDLESWGIALGTGATLSRAQFVDRLKSFGSTASDPLSPEYDSYSFGMGEISGWIGHTGNGLGFESLVMYDRANDRTIAILLNAANANGDVPADLFRDLLVVLGWTEPEGQRQVAAVGDSRAIGTDIVWTGLVSGPFDARAAVYAADGGVAAADGPVTLAPLADFVPGVFVGNDGTVELGHGGTIAAAPGGDGATVDGDTGFARLSMTDVTITMQGDAVSGTGVDVAGAGTASLDGVRIEGTALAALHAGGTAAARIEGRGLDIALQEGDGLRAGENGVIDLRDSRVILAGPGQGLVAAGISAPARIAGTCLVVETAGTAGYGILAQGAAASVTLQGSQVRTTGAGAHGVVLGDGATVALVGTGIAASGPAAAAIAALSTAAAGPPQAARLTLTGSTIAAASGTAVAAAATDLALDASGSVLTGAVVQSSQASIDLTLGDASHWTLPAAQGSVASRLSSLTSNDSTVSFTAPAAGAVDYGSLTVGSYQASGGTMVMNADLAPGAGAADRLVIDGGAATGSTRILLATRNGGAATAGDGIAVVETRNGGRTADGVFVLGSRVAAGAYDYNLYRGGATSTEDWFLSSDRADAAGGRTNLPDLRDEVPLTLAVPAMASRFGLAMLGARTARDGMQAMAGDGTPPAASRQGAWLHVLGGTGRRGSSDGTAAAQFDRFGSYGPAYDIAFSGLQAGFGQDAGEFAGGIGNLVGLYVGSGRVSGDVDAVYGGEAGTVSMDAHSLGGVWTLHGGGSWYLEAVAQGTFYDRVKIASVAGQSLETRGWGMLAAVEGGYRIGLPGGWTADPQVQFLYQGLRFDNVSDQYGQVDYRPSDTAFTRFGLQFARDWSRQGMQPLSAWLRGDLWQGFAADAEATYTSLAGAHPLTLSTDLGGRWLEMGAGVAARLAPQVGISASGSYDFRIDGDSGAGFGGRIGLRVAW